MEPLLRSPSVPGNWSVLRSRYQVRNLPAEIRGDGSTDYVDHSGFPREIATDERAWSPPTFSASRQTAVVEMQRRLTNGNVGQDRLSH
jgi:hypothetical protein